MISLTSPSPPPRAGRTPFKNWESNKNGRISRITYPPRAVSARNEPRTPRVNLWQIRGMRSRLVLWSGYRYSAGMRDTYSSDDYPFTVEDWTDPNDLKVIAVCQDVFMANAAWEAQCREYPDRKLVARWGRAHTTRRSWKD